MRRWVEREHRWFVGLLAVGAITAPSGAAARGATTPSREVATSERPAAGRQTQFRVSMRGQRFTPARVVAAVGDTILFELESGGPHNVAFDPDSIPPGALAQLARNLGTEPRYLFTPDMLLDRGETFVLPLAGLPPGSYVFFCAPHVGGGMRGELVVMARTP